jgi:hypothetical protein
MMAYSPFFVGMHPNVRRTNPEATELEQVQLPLRSDFKVGQEAKAEASKFFAANLER